MLPPLPLNPPPPAPPSPSPRPTKTPGLGTPRTVDRAVIGGVVAVVVFAMLCLLIVLGRYFAKKGTYFTHEDADTAIINAEGGHTNSDEKKEYYI
ncbi:hypothetical protein CesoFtcFv8_000172 [Champsocephalus esox]|uniref:Neurexin/syndecan/glycophorin C domain-containing protein n=1 Tax=Champsocephalus esox TaxID=159716 RepID=A0AAN8HWF0_9TELE|nr:hypothetical protein CesoFtcFv8_000171 [Champsocephalus esox]KAK5931550.1 hypothetical protein CesoFtcFv8_000172 [Champsocephalus esox]